MPSRNAQRESHMASLDSQEQAVRAGGANGKASIRGIPLRVNDEGKVDIRAAVRTGIVSEPVAVVMRDAVTIDTAVRLTGIRRSTLQTAVVSGYIPAIRLDAETAPYLVRVRDVITYLVKIGHYTRRKVPIGEKFVGFEEWFAEIVRENWQGDKALNLGRYTTSMLVPINRGGRPKGKRGAPVAHLMMTTPQEPDEEEGDSEIIDGLPTDHALMLAETLEAQAKKAAEQATAMKEAVEAEAVATAAAQEPWSPPLDRTTLPKWHPLWIRPGT